MLICLPGGWTHLILFYRQHFHQKWPFFPQALVPEMAFFLAFVSNVFPMMQTLRRCDRTNVQPLHLGVSKHSRAQSSALRTRLMRFPFFILSWTPLTILQSDTLGLSDLYSDCDKENKPSVKCPDYCFLNIVLYGKFQRLNKY